MLKIGAFLGSFRLGVKGGLEKCLRTETGRD